MRSALALWIALGALALIRLVLAFVPGMWFWGLNLQRFLDPVFSWGPWALGALALIPAAARRLEPAWSWLGDRIARRPGASSLVLAILGAWLVWAFPDVVRYVGDFLLRQGTVEEAGQPGVIYPQAQPLDVLLHFTLPSAAQNAGLFDANTTPRLMGAIEAAVLAVLAGAFARALALRGSAALAVTAAVFFGGYLCMFTGYSKALCEMVVLVVAAGVCAVRMVRRREGEADEPAGAGPALGLGITMALALALHRSAVAMVPVVIVAWVLWLRRPGALVALRRPVHLIALLVPIVAVIALGPHIVATMLRFDSVHLAPAEVKRQGVLTAAFSAMRILDMKNLVAFLAPLALLSPLLAVMLTLAGRARPSRQGGAGAEVAVLLALALAFTLAMPFIHPAQGMFRDWDDFAATGAALALLAAWLVGETLRAAGTRRWLSVGVTLAVMMPALQWLAHFNDIESGFRRVEAFMTEPPLRTGLERGTSWDYLGIRNYHLERWAKAAQGFSIAAETSPSPRILQQWAIAETMHGDLREAQRVYHRLVQKDPNNPSAWLGLAAVASRIPDPEDCRFALKYLLVLQPDNVEARQQLEILDRTHPPKK
jgi:tetratricopeptide (TPR) repeat protein